ncbi:MAG: AI-2E family transporter [Myxococcota bacterium]
MKDIGQRENRLVMGLFLVLFAFALLLFWRMASPYLTPLVLALVLASLFWSTFERLLASLKGNRTWAAALSTLLVLVVVVAPAAVVITSMSSEAFALYEKTRSDEALLGELRGLLSGESALARQLQQQAARLHVDLSPGTLSGYAASFGRSLGVFLYEQIGDVASNLLALLLHFGMMLVFLFSLFVEGPRLKAYVLDLSPLPDEEEELVAARFRSLARAVFLGNGVASALQGLFGGISFYLFGIGSGFLWGAAIAFFAFLPMVGASVVLAPAALYLFLKGQLGVAVGFLLFNLVHVVILEYIVKTRLMAGSGTNQLHGTLVFFGVVAGITAFGLMGLFYGPLVIAVALTLGEIYKTHYRDRLLGRAKDASAPSFSRENPLGSVTTLGASVPSSLSAPPQDLPREDGTPEGGGDPKAPGSTPP